MAKTRVPPSRIESVKQSPLNPSRWCLQLDCGHDTWTTAKRRPTRQSIVCPHCIERARSEESDNDR